jgi:hypothetical protein
VIKRWRRSDKQGVSPKQQGRLAFEYEAVEDDGSVTSYGGLPVVVEAMRAWGVDQSIRRHVKLRKRESRFDEVACIETLVLTLAAGGDCLDDIAALRADRALCRLLDRELPSPETVRQFLYGFHDEKLMAAAVARAAERGEASYVPDENAPLSGLGKVLREQVQAIQARRPLDIATIDADATIQESHKREAKPHYEGGRGYQPMVALWAEHDLVLADEFRDGNVPAGKDTLRVTERAFAALPASVHERRFRGDSAFYNEAQLKWLVRHGVGFTISADMSVELRELCSGVAEEQWELLEHRTNESVHVSEVEFFPGNWPKDATALRYLAVRFSPTQGRLFLDGSGPKYLAVVTNRSGGVAELLRWHWAKAGTIERVHDVVKNELGGGVLPCGRFGSNAAWFRVALLTYNILSGLKSLAMPPRLKDARPKRLRFEVFIQPAVLVSHARQLLARLANRLQRASELVTLRRNLWVAPPATPLLA